MREIKHSALIAQPPRRVFEIINDIERYPEFLPWCTHAKVISRTDREVVATVGVRKGPLNGEFTTRNELDPDKRIVMRLVSGPFRQLEGEWNLTPIGEPAAVAGPPIAKEPPTAGQQSGCRVELTMKFAFKNPLTAALFEQKFAETMTSLVDAFVARARATA
ncbi:MAG TPA: type II toxin-antitoxin system RatA family toxin [Steroidobacteraceae bacterium]|jgi:ribosome-associated toxin RatA of RatAB toxin-antitoxin module